MKSMADFAEFMKTVHVKPNGEADLPLERWLELDEFKKTLFRSPDGVRYVGTNLMDEDASEDWITWRMACGSEENGDLVQAEIIYQDGGGLYMSVYLQGEPFWHEYDPFEADTEHLRTFWSMLPETAREEYRQTMRRVDDDGESLIAYVEGHEAIAGPSL